MLQPIYTIIYLDIFLWCQGGMWTNDKQSGCFQLQKRIFHSLQGNRQSTFYFSLHYQYNVTEEADKKIENHQLREIALMHHQSFEETGKQKGELTDSELICSHRSEKKIN